MAAAIEGRLPVTYGTEPLRGWRWVRAVRADGRILAASIVDHRRPDRSEAGSRPVLFGPESDAVCQRLTHDAPAPGCRCGFWSVPEQRLLEGAVGVRLAGWALAEVELSGTVIEAERGLRAEHQRILSLTFSDRCERLGCHERSTGLTASVHGFLRAACADHGGDLTLADAAGMLGTEVRYGVLAVAPPWDGHPGRASISGGGLTFLAAVAGASSVGAVAANSTSTPAAGAAIGLAVVIGVLTGLGAALRSMARRQGGRRRPTLDVLATLAALSCMAVSVTAVIATTTPPTTP